MGFESNYNPNNVADEAVRNPRNFYNDLGVEPTATPDEIKAAYRKLALKHHPDIAGDDEIFKIINEANSVLSDSALRQRYDSFRPKAQTSEQRSTSSGSAKQGHYEYKSAPDPESPERNSSVDTQREKDIARLLKRFDEISALSRASALTGTSKTAVLQDWLKRFTIAQRMIKFSAEIWEKELNEIGGAQSEQSEAQQTRQAEPKQSSERRERGAEKYSLAERQQCYTDFIIAQAPHLKMLRKDERFNAPYIERMKNFVAAVGRAYNQADFDVEIARKNFADMIADDKKRNNIR